MIKAGFVVTEANREIAGRLAGYIDDALKPVEGYRFVKLSVETIFGMRTLGTEPSPPKPITT